MIRHTKTQMAGVLFAPLILCTALIATGCGGEGSAETSSAKSAPVAVLRRVKPKIDVPDGPPPRRLVINDLEEGTGAVAKEGDELFVHEVGFIYDTAEELESAWGDSRFGFELGEGQVIDGWEQGLVGMRVGGRRQLVIPSRLAYGKGPVIYVFDLLEIK
jgi:peptidylprolyl isomerase